MVPLLGGVPDSTLYHAPEIPASSSNLRRVVDYRSTVPGLIPRHKCLVNSQVFLDRQLLHTYSSDERQWPYPDFVRNLRRARSGAAICS